MSIFKRVAELEKRNEDLEKMVISLAQTVAEMSEMTDKVAKHEQIIEHLDDHMMEIVNEAYNNAAREMSAGIDQVLNFTPYGVK